ncbi:MAG: SLC13/DASS family transporter [Oscillospiraceae bacterium]|nr:SLC13/DASS family transporter [Oscillospiraceae bacterium]
MPTSVISIIILAAVVVLFLLDKFPNGVVAMAGLMAMLVFKCCSTADAMSGFASDIFLLVFGMLIMGEAMFSSGAAGFIGYYAVKLSANNERRFILISCLISAALSAFLTNTAVIAMMMAICLAVSESSENMKYRNLVIPVAIAAILGGHCTMAGSTTQLTTQGLLEAASGETFGMWDLGKVCLPITLVTILYMTYVGYGTGKKIWGSRTDEADTKSVNKVEIKEVKLSKEGAKTLAIFGLVILLFVTGWTSSGVAAVIGAVLVVVTGCVGWKKALSHMDWNTLVWLSACLGLGKALSSSGGSALIGNWMLGIVGEGAAPIVLFAAMVAIAMLMSQFMSNMACLIVILPGTLEMVISRGLSPYTFAYGMCLGAALTYLTPLANGHIGMTASAGYKFSDYVRYSFVPTIIAYVMIVGLTPLFYSLAA